MSNYLHNSSKADSKTVFTEIIIDATPEKVREVFLEFDKWSEWNSAILNIKVIKGNLNDIASKPKIELSLDLNGSGKINKLPIAPTVWANSKEVFSWGADMGFILRAEHTFLFEPKDDGTATRLVHYERASGLLSALFMSSKTKYLMNKGYNRMNNELKRLCE